MKPLLLALLLCTLLFSFGQKTIDSRPIGKPVLFAPGIVSDAFENRDMALSPAGDELFFTIQHRAFSVIMTSKKKGNGWTEPEVSPFSGRYKDLEAAFGNDGNKIFFSSNRPIEKGREAADYNIWFTERKANGWTEPLPLGSNINTTKDEYYPSVARNGNLYFTRENDSTKEDIFLAEFRDGAYAVPNALPMEVNSKGYDFNAFIDPDETFIIFTSYKRSDDRGGGDLYMSAKKDGQWKPAKNLGDAVNSTSIDYCPFVSFDKKQFFFTSKRLGFENNGTKPMDAKTVKAILSSAGNGSDDIYVMDFASVNRLLND